MCVCVCVCIENEEIKTKYIMYRGKLIYGSFKN